MITRVALYTRISPKPEDKKGKDKGIDTVNQERELRIYAERQGWEVVEHYNDTKVSGAKKGSDRPEFKRMMEDASKRKFDILLFWSLDRLSREGVYETFTYLTQLTNYGVLYKSYTEQYIDSCGVFKDAIVGILAAIAKQERVRIQERTMAGLDTARAKGVKLGRPIKIVDRVIAKQMREEGKRLRDIGDRFGVSEATMSRILREDDVSQELEL